APHHSSSRIHWPLALPVGVLVSVEPLPGLCFPLPGLRRQTASLSPCQESGVCLLRIAASTIRADTISSSTCSSASSKPLAFAVFAVGYTPTRRLRIGGA